MEITARYIALQFGKEFLECLITIKLPGEVITHHSNREVCNSRQGTRSITLVGSRLTISQIHPLLDIVEYDHLVTSTPLFYKGGVTT